MIILSIIFLQVEYDIQYGGTNKGTCLIKRNDLGLKIVTQDWVPDSHLKVVLG